MAANQAPLALVPGNATTWKVNFEGGMLPQNSEVSITFIDEYQARFPRSDLRQQCRQPWAIHVFLAADNEPAEYEDHEESPVTMDVGWRPGATITVLPAHLPPRPNKTAIYCPDSVDGVAPFPNLIVSTITNDRSNCDLADFTGEDLLAMCNVCGLPAYPTGKNLTLVTARTALLDLLHHMINITIEDFDFQSAHLHRYVHWGPVAIGLLYGYLGIPREDATSLEGFQNSFPGVALARHLVTLLHDALESDQPETYTVYARSILHNIVQELGVQPRLADHMRAVPSSPTVLPFDSGVVVHLLYQAWYNPAGPWIGGVRGIQALIHAFTWSSTPLGPVPQRQAAHTLVRTTLRAVSPLFWVNPMDHTKFASLAYPQQLAIVIQGPAWLCDYDPERSSNIFRHNHMNLALLDARHCPDVREGRFLLSIHGEDSSITNTETLRSFLWTLYKGYAVLALGGANPLALLTSFANPCKDAALLTLRTVPGHEHPVDDTDFTDFGGLRGATAIKAAYDATGGDEFYTLCGRNMPTILAVTKFHRDYFVFSTTRLLAGPLRQEFVDLAWKKQFAMFHCFSTIHPRCPPHNIKIPIH